MFRSIRMRLTASYVALAVLTAATVGLLALYLMSNDAERKEREYLLQTGRALTHQILPLLAEGRKQMEIRNLARAAGFLSNVRIRVMDPGRNLLVDSGEPRPPGPEQALLMLSGIFSSGRPGLPAPPQLRERSYALIRRQHGMMGYHFLLEPLESPGERRQAVPGPELPEPDLPKEPAEGKTYISTRTITLPVGDRKRPLGFVELSQGPDFRRQTLAAAWKAVALSSAGAALLAILIGLFMSRRLTAPLIQLAGAVNRFDDRNLHVRAPVQGKDEIGLLAVQFNRMAGRLEQSFQELSRERDSLKQFAADASHELRTPVTALRTNIELLQSGAGEDPATRQEFLSESENMLRRLEWIIRSLLDLSRYDAGLFELNFKPHPPAEIMRSALSAHKGRMEEGKIRLSADLEQAPPLLRCDREQLEMALSNLLDNAIKHLREDSLLEVGVEEREGRCLFIIRDNGPGIDPEDLPFIFNRFYRSRKSSEQGSGLGLAIVKSIAAAHGGSVTVESQVGRGSEFRLELPLEGPDGGNSVRVPSGHPPG